MQKETAELKRKVEAKRVPTVEKPKSVRTSPKATQNEHRSNSEILIEFGDMNSFSSCNAPNIIEFIAPTSFVEPNQMTQAPNVKIAENLIGILNEFDPISSNQINTSGPSVSNVVLLSEAIKVWPSTQRPIPNLIPIGLVPCDIEPSPVEPIHKKPPIYMYHYVSNRNRPHECLISNQVYLNMINTLNQTTSTANPPNLLDDVDAHANADEIKIRDIDMCSLFYEHFGSLDFE